MDAEPLTIEVPGLVLAAQAWGAPDAPPVLALHGWLDNAASFEPLAPYLGGVRLVALDLPGHGLSDHRPPGASYDFVEWVVDVAAVADALGWGRFALLGHSMGAGVASLVAGTLPERISGLALVEGLGPNAVAVEDAPARLARSIAERGRREARPAREHPDRASAEERLRAVAGLSQDAARRLVLRGTREVPGGVVWRADARLRGTSPFRITEAHVEAFLRRIACASVLVRARGGYPFDQGVLEQRAAAVRGAHRVDVDGGHHVHMDEPARIAALVGPYLRGEVPAPAPAPAGVVAQADPDLDPDLARRAAAVRVVVLDVDGVLTNGELGYDADGDATKHFFVRDGLGIKLLQRAGVRVAILSGRASASTLARARELGLDPVLTGVADKAAALDEALVTLGLGLEAVAYMGDDVVDLAVLRRVGLPAAPSDAHPEARRAARLVTAEPGGRGAVRALAEVVLRAQGHWQRVLGETSWPAKAL